VERHPHRAVAACPDHGCAGSGVQASALGAIANGNAEQGTHDGHLLHDFIRDTSGGSTADEGINHFGGSGHVISQAGKGIQPDSKVLASFGMQ